MKLLVSGFLALALSSPVLASVTCVHDTTELYVAISYNVSKKNYEATVSYNGGWADGRNKKLLKKVGIIKDKLVFTSTTGDSIKISLKKKQTQKWNDNSRLADIKLKTSED